MAQLKMTRNIALFDMDGTLANYDQSMLSELQKIHSEHEPPLNFDRLHDLPGAYEARRQLIKRLPGFWLGLKPFRLGFQVLHLCKSLEFDIHILIKGPTDAPNAWKEKVEWCQSYVDPDVKINIVNDKGLTYGKVLVDDYPGYIASWLEWRPRGLVIMPAHEYNKDFKHPNVIRYDGNNYEEIKEALVAAKNREHGLSA